MKYQNSEGGKVKGTGRRARRGEMRTVGEVEVDRHKETEPEGKGK